MRSRRPFRASTSRVAPPTRCSIATSTRFAETSRPPETTPRRCHRDTFLPAPSRARAGTATAAPNRTQPLRGSEGTTNALREVPAIAVAHSKGVRLHTLNPVPQVSTAREETKPSCDRYLGPTMNPNYLSLGHPRFITVDTTPRSALTTTPPAVVSTGAELPRSTSPEVITAMHARDASESVVPPRDRLPRSETRKSALDTYMRAPVARKRQMSRRIHGGATPDAGMMETLRQSLAQSRADDCFVELLGEVYGRTDLPRDVVEEFRASVARDIASSLTDRAVIDAFQSSDVNDACGQTVNAMRNLFFAPEAGDAIREVHQRWLRAADKLPIGASMIETASGITTGTGVAALRELVEANTGPLYIQVELSGAGHIYVLEVRPRDSVEDDVRAFQHQSYIGHYSEAEWAHTSGHKSKKVSRHLDDLAVLESKSASYSERVASYDALNGTPGSPFRRLWYGDKPIRVVFTACPFDSGATRARLADRLR